MKVSQETIYSELHSKTNWNRRKWKQEIGLKATEIIQERGPENMKWAGKCSKKRKKYTSNIFKDLAKD